MRFRNFCEIIIFFFDFDLKDLQSGVSVSRAAGCVFVCTAPFCIVAVLNPSFMLILIQANDTGVG